MASNEGIKILLVDDRPENLLAYRAILGEMDLELVLVNSGTDALKQVLLHDFAVILLDVNMPGMDGFETATLIRKRKRSMRTPIIFVTAFHDDMRAGQGYASGAVDYLSSPIVPEVLKAKVKVFVELFRMTTEVQRQGEARLALAQERMQRTAAEEAKRQLEFLAEITALLGRSLDHKAMARDLARTSVPTLGDCVVVARHDSNGEWDIVQARASGDGVIVQACRDLDDVPPHLAEAIRDILAESTEQITTAPRCDLKFELPHTVVFQLSGPKSHQTALGISREMSGRVFSADDISVVDSLGWRAAMAFENACLYHDLETADRQKDEFLSMLAHELRNPLAPIRTAVDLLRLRGSDDPQSCAATDVIDRQTNHLVRLVDELLDVSRITLGKIHLNEETVDLASVVNASVETSRPMIDALNHELTISLPDEPVRICCDRVRLSQVLANLLNNAAKYTPEGGTIALSATGDGDDVVLKIADNGIGIPPEMISKIFGLFSQVERSLDRSQGGLGIGLTLVKRLVEMHGGTVQASSAGSGHGSEFTVRLPIISREQSVEVDEPETPEPVASNVLRVLVVDDNIDAAKTTAILMTLNGHRVRVAHDGKQALEEAQTFRPHAVLLDIGLPELDGFEVARRLRGFEETRDSLLVAVSGYGQDDDRRRATEAGFNLHFVKPVDSALLLRAVSQVQAAELTVR